MRLTKCVVYTALVWARDRDEASRGAEEDFSYLVGAGEITGSSMSVECVDDLSANPYCANDKSYNIDSGEWTSEPQKEAK